MHAARTDGARAERLSGSRLATFLSEQLRLHGTSDIEGSLGQLSERCSTLQLGFSGDGVEEFANATWNHHYSVHRARYDATQGARYRPQGSRIPAGFVFDV
ncbi:hypothetical protein GCM10020219_004530 [Nonomuraea dietziae]